MPLSVDDIEQARTSAGICFATNSRQIWVGGKDAERYLHGRLTQDIKSLPDSEGKLSLLLSPQGHVDGICRIFRLQGRFLLTLEERAQGYLDKFTSALLRFKVADQVELEIGSSSVLSVFGPDSGRLLQEAGLDKLPVKNFEIQCFDHQGSRAYIVANNQVFPGFEVLTPPQSLLTRLVKSVPELDPELLEYCRIAVGEPALEHEITNEIRAPDLALEPFISPNKGCYTGQEVIEMAAARGRPNKITLGFSAFAASKVSAGMPLFCTDKKVGRVTSAIEVPGQNKTIGIAIVKADVSLKHIVTESGQQLDFSSPTPLRD